MMSKTRFPRFRSQGKPLHQVGPMRKVFPQFRERDNRRGGLRWEGQLRPSPDSTEYSIRIDHDSGKVPRVFVDNPPIDKSAPHRYPGGDLCLYWPKEWRWSANEKLSETLVPWIALWLYYYEIWQFCGKWLGPSSPHGSPKDDAGQ